MRKLILDTSGRKIGIGIFDGFNCISENYIETDGQFNKILINKIDKILKDNKLKLKDFDSFGITLGPGSFTGIRIGISIIKAWAYSFDKKVFGMSTLDIMAESINKNKGEVIFPALNAKRNELYVCFNTQNSNKIYDIISIDEYIKLLKNNKNFHGVLLNEDKYLIIASLNKNNKMKIDFVEKIDLKVFNQLIENKKIENTDIYTLKPIYIRESDAERNLKEKIKNGKV